jgi:CSLREA domain-containing protein
MMASGTLPTELAGGSQMSPFPSFRRFSRRSHQATHFSSLLQSNPTQPRTGHRLGRRWLALALVISSLSALFGAAGVAGAGYEGTWGKLRQWVRTGSATVAPGTFPGNAVAGAAMAATLYVDDTLVITTDTGPAGLSAGDIVTFAFGEAGQTTGLTFGTDAFDTMQNAISAAVSGDTIMVAAGTYNGPQILIDKAVHVLGAGQATTIIDGLGAAPPTAGLVHIETPPGDTGNVTFSGFTITNPGVVGTLRYAIYAKPLDPATTVTITQNKVQGVGAAGPTIFDLALWVYRNQGQVVFDHNEITNVGGNKILIEQPLNATDVHHNTIAALGASSMYFNMTYDSENVTSLQRVADNTINGSTATAINFNTAPTFVAGPARFGKYTNVQILNNVITQLGAGRSGIALLNDTTDATGALGAIENPVITGNSLTGTDAATSNAIRFRGLIVNATIQNNNLRDTDRGFFGELAGAGHSATGTLLKFNSLVGNLNGLVWNGAAAVNAENNWWGCNFGPGAGGTGCSGSANAVGGTGAAQVDANPCLVLGLTATPNSLTVGGMSNLTADLTFNSDNTDTTGLGNLPNGTPVSFAGVNGTVAPPAATTTLGEASAVFTATASGAGSASTTVDAQTVTTPITISCPAPLTVNDLGDAPDATPGNGVCETAASNGICTLRAAIQEANALSTCAPLTINFSVAGTINVGSALPTITQAVVINAFQGINTCPAASLPAAAALQVVLNGGGGAYDGLTFNVTNGGPSAVRGLVIQNFGQHGIVSQTTNAANYLTVECNYVGTDAAGTGAVGNGGPGILLDASPSNVVQHNLISGNGGFGVYVSGAGASGNMILGNYLGTDLSGTGAVPNSDGVVITGPNNIVGGTNAGERNLISGNTSDAIFITLASASGNQVLGNYLGTDVTGTLDLGNGADGVALGNGAANNTIGGTTASARNLISGNNRFGLYLFGGGTTGNKIIGNYIGTDVSGTNPLGNASDGVLLYPDGGNSVGGTNAGEGNIIAHNGRAGVDLVAGSNHNNPILGNSIFGNTGLGIDLSAMAGTPGEADGLTANDADDADTGANQLQNFPVLSSVSATGVVNGALDSLVANTAYPVRIEFFANTACDASGNGEGEVYLGSTTVNAPGNFTANLTLVSGKNFITATATDSDGNTSEFSACQQVNVPPTVLSLVRGNASPTNSGGVTFNLLFSEPVTSPTSSNFTLIPGGSVTGALITNVVCNMAAGSCVITVNTGTGSGTLGLNMTNSTGVADSAGDGVSNLTFVGQVYTLDKDAPDTMITSNPANPTNSNSATFQFTGSDSGGSNLAGFECKLDAGNFTACTSPQNYSSLADGSHTFEVRAFDGAGNVDPSPATFTWTVDTTPPTVTINQAAGQADPTGSSPINFTAVFSEPVSGFGLGDVTLSGTAGATTFIITESAPLDGTTYNVAVSGMANDGTVIATVSSGSVQDAAANPNAASTSTDNIVTYTTFVCPVTLMVNDLGDTADANAGDGFCNDGTGKCTLRAALEEANSTAAQACAPLTINFSVTGVINLATVLPALNHPNLTINGPGATNLTVTRNSATPFRIFAISASQTVSISGLKITNGLAPGTNNGGGVHNSGTLNLSQCVISGNAIETTSVAGSGFGGGLYSSGPLTIDHCEISGNSGRSGAGIAHNGLGSGFPLIITNSTISGNTGVQSGGFDIRNTTASLTNCTISGNSAPGRASGIDQVAQSGNTSSVSLTNCTVTNNSGSVAIETFGFAGVASLTTTLKNTLVAGNVGANFTNEMGTVTSLGNNLDSDGTSGFTNGANGDIVGTQGNPLNALLAPLGNYGGPTQTHALLPGSPAINAGTGTGAPTNDQRGLARVGNVDIGAVEAQTFTLAITGGNNQSTVVNTAFATALQVNLKEGTTNLPGAVITFAGPGSGASLNPASGTATTDASGNASRSVTANTVAGGPYAVAATTGALSQPFSLTNLPGAPAQLAFGQQPTQTVVLASVSPAVTVRVLDAFGNLTNSNAAVMLVLGANPGGATLGGTTLLNAINGVATFNALTLNQIGVGYTLVASSAGLTPATSLPFNITCPAITLAALPGGTAGTAYNQTVTAAPAGGNYMYAVTGGTLPNGLTLAANGTLSGTPTLAGTFTFSVTATGFGSCTGTQSYTLVIACPTFILSPASLPNATVNTAYPPVLTASPAGGNYSFAVTSGALPNGLSLNSNGSFSGAPTLAGSFSFRVTATGWGTCTGFRDYVLLVVCPALSLSPASLPGGTVGTAYNQAVSASPAGSYHYSVTSGALPTGLSLNSASGALSGTPAASGTFTFTLTAAAGGCAGSQSYTVVITCPTLSLTPASLPNAQAGVAYNQTVAAPGATNYSLLTGNLPPGFNLNAATGTLAGTATATGIYNFTIQAAAPGGCSGTQAYSIVVTCPVITLSPASLPAGTTGTVYSQSLSASPAGNYSFAKTSGTLPPGLSLNAAGSLSGNPTTQGTYTFTVTATGFGACTGSLSYTVTITASCATITLPNLPATGKVGVNYSGNLAATTPSASYTFSVQSGALPPGLAINNLFGLLSGKPTAAGSYTFTLKAARSNGCTGTREYTVVISSALAALARQGDYDGDGKSDPALWSSQTGVWQILRSRTQAATQQSWGAAGDVTLQGDYDGDGLSDLAVFRPADATFYVKRSSDGSALVKPWGSATDVPVPGDYDGDGQTDLAVFRPSDGHWYVLRSSDGQAESTAWGAGFAPYRDIAVPGDYDGDGQTDLAVFRQQTGTWLIKRSSDGQMTVKAWGLGSDVPVAGDYDGDGKSDLAVWRGATGQWFVLKSSDQSYAVTAWGAASVGDVPAPGDYDGDGKTDLTVWRAPEGKWYIFQSSAGFFQPELPSAQSGDRPVTAGGR